MAHPADPMPRAAPRVALHGLDELESTGRAAAEDRRCARMAAGCEVGELLLMFARQLRTVRLRVVVETAETSWQRV